MSRLLAGLREDKGGSAAALFALSLPPLLATTAVAVDFGQIYAAERDLQSIADAAAMAAVDSENIPESAAGTVAEIVRQSQAPGIVVDHVTAGKYSRDPSLSLHERFAPGDEDANAVEVELTQKVELLVAGPLIGAEGSTVRAFSRASRTEMVAFDLNTKAVSISQPVAEEFLSALLGSDIELSDDALDALLAERIDVLRMAENLVSAGGNPGLDFSEVFDSEMPLADVLEAMAEATDDAALRDALRNMADGAGEGSVVLSDIIDLGPYGSLHAAVDGDSVMVDAYSLLRNTLEASHGEGYDIALDLELAGLGGTSLRMAGGRGYERSPWLSISEAYDVVLRTGQARIYAETSADVPGAGKVLLPLYLELAPAEAQIASVTCDPADARNGVTIEARPSLGTLALASVDLTGFGDFGTELETAPATLLQTRLARVTAYADVDLGGNQSVDVHLSLEDIRQKLRKEAGTEDLLETGIASLLGNADIEIEALGLGLGTSLLGLDSSISDLLGSLTPGLDDLVNQLSEATGTKLGVAEVGVIRLECGVPAIVA